MIRALLGIDWLARKLGYVEQDVRTMGQRLVGVEKRVECRELADAYVRERLTALAALVERPLIEGPSVPDGCERVLIATLRCKACKYSVPATGEHNCAARPAPLRVPEVLIERGGEELCAACFEAALREAM